MNFGRDSWQKPVHGMPATRRRVLTHMCCVSCTEAAAVGCALVEPVEICAMLAETDGTASTAEAEGGVENMLLVALTSLYTDEREADVRLGVLRVAINVLQRHGASPYATGRQIPKRPPGFNAHPWQAAESAVAAPSRCQRGRSKVYMCRKWQHTSIF